MSPISMTLSKSTQGKSHSVFSFALKAVPLPLLVRVTFMADSSPASMELLGMREALSEYWRVAMRFAGRVCFSKDLWPIFLIA